MDDPDGLTPKEREELRRVHRQVVAERPLGDDLRASDADPDGMTPEERAILRREHRLGVEVEELTGPEDFAPPAGVVFPTQRFKEAGATSAEIAKQEAEWERLGTVPLPGREVSPSHQMVRYFAELSHGGLEEWLELQRILGYFQPPKGAGTTDPAELARDGIYISESLQELRERVTALEASGALGIPLAQKGAAGGVGTLDSESHQPVSQLSPSVETSSTIGWFNVKNAAYGAPGVEGQDSRPAVAAAFAAAVAHILATGHSATVFLPDGIYEWLTGVTKAALAETRDLHNGTFPLQGIPLPVNLPARLNIEFAPGATIKLSEAAHTAFFIDKQADYDVFRRIHFWNPRIDNNNAVGRSHLLVGNVPAFATKQMYLSFEDLYFHGKYRGFNVPIDPTGETTAKYHVQLIGDHKEPLEAIQTFSKDIIFDEDFFGEGGDGLIAVAATNAARVRPGGCNHYHDNIRIGDGWKHTIPNPATQQIFQTHIQVCLGGFGDYFSIGRGYGQNSGDDGIEIGAMQSGDIHMPQIKNSFLEHLFFRHTHAPINPLTQEIRIHGLRAEVTSALSQGSTGYQATPIRFQMDDPIITITETGSPTGGTWKLTIPGTAGAASQETGALPRTCTAAELETAVQTAAPGSKATGGPINTAPITLKLANVAPESIPFATSSLTGGSSPTVTTELSLASPLMGTFIFDSPVFEADQLQYTKQSSVAELFIRGLSQPVRRVEVRSPKMHLTKYNYDGAGVVDLAFIRPRAPTGVWPSKAIVSNAEATVLEASPLNEAYLHGILVEGTGSTDVDGFETDFSGVTSAGGLQVATVAKTGGSNVRADLRRCRPRKLAGGGVVNWGVRVQNGGTVKRCVISYGDFTTVGSGREIDLTLAGENRPAVTLIGNIGASGPHVRTAVSLVMLPLVTSVDVTSTAEARTITLPAINAVPVGPEHTYTVYDDSNGAATHNIAVICAGSDEYIDGTTSKSINNNGGRVAVYSDGAKWVPALEVLGASVPEAASPSAPSAGVSSSPARSDHKHPRYEFAPADHGLLGWTFDPIIANANGSLAAAGTISTAQIHVPKAVSVTNVLLYVAEAGVLLTSGQCFAALFQAGALIGVSADQASAWQSGGVKTMALAGGPFALAAGDIVIAWFANGTTLPKFSRQAGIALVNVGLAAASSRFGTADTGRTTTMPSTLGTIAAASNSWWAGIS
jgi:hypothetical protein